jgi:hypothetical protein
MHKLLSNVRAYFQHYGARGLLSAALVAGLGLILSLLVLALWRSADRPLLALPASITNPVLEPVPPDPDKLEILQTSPVGPLNTAQLEQEVVVVFSQPMVPLGKVSDARREAFRIEPAIKGVYRWYGTRVAAFIPEEPLKPGSAYRVTVPVQKSLNNKELEKSYAFSFRTPPLRLNYSYPYSGRRIEYKTDFKLFFNYAVSLRDINRFVQLFANGRRVDFEATYKMSDNEDEAYYEGGLDGDAERHSVRLIPDEELPRDAKIQVLLKKGMPPEGGNDGLEKDKTIHYQTYGPLEVKLVEEGDYFQDAWSTGLKFNNPVNPEEAVKHIRLEPGIKRSSPDGGQSEFLSIREWPVEPGQKVTIFVSGDLTDAFGNRLGSDKKFTVTMPVYRPSFSMAYGTSEVIESEMRQLLPASMAAVKEYKVGHRSLDVSDIQASLDARSISKYLSTVNYKFKNVETNLGPTDASTFGVDFSSALDGKKKGWIALEVNANTVDWQGKPDKEIRRRIIQSTNLGLIAKESPLGIDVWVNRLDSNAPVSGANVEAYTARKSHGKCKTDGAGHCRIERSQSKLDSRTLIVASTAEDRAFLTARDHYRYTWSVSSYFDSDAGYPDLKGTIEFDRKLYRPGETIHIKAFLALLQTEN